MFCEEKLVRQNKRIKSNFSLFVKELTKLFKIEEKNEEKKEITFVNNSEQCFLFVKELIEKGGDSILFLELEIKGDKKEKSLLEKIFEKQKNIEMKPIGKWNEEGDFVFFNFENRDLLFYCIDIETINQSITSVNDGSWHFKDDLNMVCYLVYIASMYSDTEDDFLSNKYYKRAIALRKKFH